MSDGRVFVARRLRGPSITDDSNTYTALTEALAYASVISAFAKNRIHLYFRARVFAASHFAHTLHKALRKLR